MVLCERIDLLISCHGITVGTDRGRQPGNACTALPEFSHRFSLCFPHASRFAAPLLYQAIKSAARRPKEELTLHISGNTTLLGLIGTPVAHSKSPAMYNHCFAKFGLDWAYLAFDIPLEKTGEAVQAIRTLHMRGANVTMPCKNAVIPYLDKLTPAAQAIQAVNTIVNENGVLVGHNTDGCGYTQNLRRNGVEVAGKRIVLLGGGGAASAIAIQAALEGAAEIAVFNRRDEFWSRIDQGLQAIAKAAPGCAISLHDLLDEVSVDAARWYFNAKPDTQMEFDLGLAVREDSENPIYYVEYAHARICSLLRALETDGVTVPETADLSLLSGEAEKALIKQIAQYCEEIKLAARDYDPSHINRCLQELAACFHRFYTACRIRGEEPQVAAARLKLADDTRMVLKNGLKLIGVDAPEKM